MKDKELIKYFRYFFFFIFLFIVTKWIVLYFLPSGLPEYFLENNRFKKETNLSVKKVTKPKKIVKEVELEINFSSLKPKIEKEYKKARRDIIRFIRKQLYIQKKQTLHRLTKKDGFLDWLFGWDTGYKILYKKIKGIFGSKDNEIKMISEEFKRRVLEPGLSERLIIINEYVRNRIEDFYTTSLAMTVDYINKKIKNLKLEGYTDIEINQTTIPWNKYIVSVTGNIYTLSSTARGLGLSTILISKYVGSKIGSLVGAKAVSIIGAKTAYLAGAKMVSLFEFILAPVIDYVANEAVKAIKYDETKKAFEKIINKIFYRLNYNLQYQAIRNLYRVKKKIYKELKKKIKLKAKKVIIEKPSNSFNQNKK